MHITGHPHGARHRQAKSKKTTRRQPWRGIICGPPGPIVFSYPTRRRVNTTRAEAPKDPGPVEPCPQPRYQVSSKPSIWPRSFNSSQLPCVLKKANCPSRKRKRSRSSS